MFVTQKKVAVSVGPGVMAGEPCVLHALPETQDTIKCCHAQDKLIDATSVTRLFKITKFIGMLVTGLLRKCAFLKAMPAASFLCKNHVIELCAIITRHAMQTLRALP